MNFENAFSEVLESRLNRGAKGACGECINAGAAGPGADQELPICQHEVSKNIPNLVAVMSHDNEVLDNSTSTVPGTSASSCSWNSRRVFKIQTRDSLYFPFFGIHNVDREQWGPPSRSKAQPVNGGMSLWLDRIWGLFVLSTQLIASQPSANSREEQRFREEKRPAFLIRGLPTGTSRRRLVREILVDYIRDATVGPIFSDGPSVFFD